MLTLIKASVILAILQLLVLALRNASAATKHLLLTIGMSAFVVMPLVAHFAPEWQITYETRASAAPAPGCCVEPAALGRRELPTTDDGSRLYTSLWAVVSIALLVRLLLSAFRLRSIVKHATPASPRIHSLANTGRIRILCSDRVHVPMVWGLRTGTLLLPTEAESWPDGELRATLIHELGHLQRLDYLSLALLNLVTSVLWFHPQVWIARRRAIAEGERACDDLVLRAGERASSYASHLLNVARLAPHREPLAAFLAMSRPSQLEGRMLSILAPDTNRQSIGGKRLMLAITAFLAIVVPLSVMQISAQPAPPAPPAAPAPVALPAPVAPKAIAPLPPAPAPKAIPAPAPVARPATPAPRAIAPTPAVPPTPSPTPAPVTLPAPSAPVAAPAPTPLPTPAPAVAPVPPTPAALPQVTPAPAAPLPPDLSRPHRKLGKIKARGYTLKLHRPVNTGDPSRNAAETVAMRRLAEQAAKKNADAMVNVRCAREIRIGLVVPTAVVCTADAIAFE